MKNKTYVTYQCSTCKRTIDKEFNPNNAFIEKCSITYSCTGKLYKVAEKNSLNLITPVVDGIENWRPRNTKIANITYEKQGDLLYFAGTTESNKLTIGVKRSPLVESSYGIKLRIATVKDKVQPVTEYYFKVTNPTNTFSGNDNSLEQNPLLFDSSDTVLVYVDGVKQQPSLFPPGVNEVNLPYKTNKEDNSIPTNTIVFYNPLQINKIVTIVVMKHVDLNYGFLNFIKHGLTTSIGAWGNLKSITKFNEKTNQNEVFDLFTLESANGIAINDRIQTITEPCIQVCQDHLSLFDDGFVPDGGFIEYPTIGLFARPPFTIKDRNLNNFFDYSDLVGVTMYLKYENISSTKMWMISSPCINSVFPQINRKEYIVFGGKTIIDSAIKETSNSTNIIMENPIFSNYIIGS